MQTTTKLTAMAAVIGAFAMGGAQASINIDNFTDDQTVAQAGVGTNTGTIAVPGSDFDNREIMIDVITTGQATTGMSATASGGVLSMNKDSDTTAKGWVTWTAGSPLDFTMGGVDDSIDFQVNENNVPIVVTFDVMDGDGTTGYYQFGSIPFIGSGSPSTETFQFGAVAWNSEEDQSGSDVSADIDWTAISQFSLHLDSTGFANGSDTVFELIQTSDRIPPPSVPAPASIMLMGLGLVGLGAYRRKRA